MSRHRVTVVVAVLIVVGALFSVSQWRGDAPAPAGVQYVDAARMEAQGTTTPGFVALRFVEARCRKDVNVTVYVFEPALAYFGSTRSYAVAAFRPTSCTGGDCGGVIGPLSPAEFEVEVTAGATAGSCG